MSRTLPEERPEVTHPPAGEDLPGGTPPPAVGASSAGPARSWSVAAKSERSLFIAFVAGFVVATVIFAVLVSRKEGSPYKARQYYQRIQLGMTRTEVKRLMQPSYAMYTTLEASDIMIIDERFMIAVTYGPKPPYSAHTMFSQPPNDWVVKQKVYVDHLRRSWLENLTTGLGLRPERVTSDRVREP